MTISKKQEKITTVTLEIVKKIALSKMRINKLFLIIIIYQKKKKKCNFNKVVNNNNSKFI